MCARACARVPKGRISQKSRRYQHTSVEYSIFASSASVVQLHCCLQRDFVALQTLIIRAGYQTLRNVTADHVTVNN